MKRILYAIPFSILVLALAGCLQQPVSPTPQAPVISTPTPTPLPSLTPTEWTGETHIIYWTKAPFRRYPPQPSPPKPTPTAVPTPVPPTIFGQKCANDADCPEGYFCNSFNRTFYKYDESGNSTMVTESYGDKTCYIACGSDSDCAKGERCGFITKYRGQYEGKTSVCAKR